MTIEKFNVTRFGAGMQCAYDGKIRKIASVDFREKLIGLESTEEPPDNVEEPDIQIDWVRCENVTIV